ncbi:MAG TPA: FoF1 ATP synthase subunit a [Candidatus Limiplasma sp.]|nr:FoF1 ATP synthase subunit a [Candidatus Limiplasma sp.]HPS81619.1 FoF1 ATP synthase subunit a [Candidatus Limiplasma sp.]
MLEVSLFPTPCYVFGVNVGLSVVMSWCIMGLLLTGLVLIHFLVVRRMKPVPTGAQNVVELIVDGMHRWAEGKIGHAADFVAPVSMTLMTYVFFNTIVELFGLPPATEDINCTFAMGLCTFITVNVSGLKFRGGVRGRIKGLCNPSAIVMPIRILTDFIAPCSIAIRLFANIMVGGIIMQLIYAVVPIILPAVVASYFNVLHVGIQTFVLGLLTLVYVSEAIE